MVAFLTSERAARRNMPECKDCEKKEETAVVPGGPGGIGCEETYAAVESCMRDNRNQATVCKDAWNAFRDCRKAAGLK